MTEEAIPSLRPESPSPAARKPSLDELASRATPVAWVTPSLVALILVGFAVEAWLGVSPWRPTGEQLVNAGAGYGPRVLLNEEWWRLVAVMFLHGGVLHLALNIFALWPAGRLAERVFGNGAYLVLYVLSGLGGSLASLTWSPTRVAVGASGAVLGVYAALLAFLATHARLLSPRDLRSFRYILLGSIAGAFIPIVENIDMAAHLGGVATGAVAGFVLSRDLHRPREHVGRRIAGGAFVVVVLALFSWGLRQRIASAPEIHESAVDSAGAAALEAHDANKAIETYTQALAERRDPAWLHGRALAYLQTHQLDLALRDLLEADGIASTPGIRSRLCEVGFRLGESVDTLEAAARYCTRVIEEDPKNATALVYRASVRMAQHRNDDAAADATAALLLDEDDVSPRRTRAIVRLQMGKVDDAEADCVKLMARATPALVDFHVCVAVPQQRGDEPTFRARLDRGLAMNPEDPQMIELRAKFGRAGQE